MGQTSDRIKPSFRYGAKRQGGRRHIRDRAGLGWKGCVSLDGESFVGLARLSRYSFRSAAASASVMDCLPAKLETLSFLCGDGPVRAALAQESEAEAIGFVGGVDDGGYMIQATLASVEIGVADGRAVAGGVIADLVERVAESRLASLGDLAQAFGIAGFVSDQGRSRPGPRFDCFCRSGRQR